MAQAVDAVRTGAAVAPGLAHGSIVLDLGEGAVRAVQTRPRQQPRVCAFPVESGSLDCLEATAACLAGVLERRGFRGGRVTLVAPRSLTKASLVALPRAGEGVPVEAIVRAEVARVHEIEGGFEVISWPLPRSSDATGDAGVMVQAIEHKPAMEIVRALERQGLVVQSMLPATPLLTRAAGSLGLVGQGMCVLIDAGWRSTHVTALVAGVCVYQRSLSNTGLGAALRGALRGSVSIADVIESEGPCLADVPAGRMVHRAAMQVAEHLGREARRVADYASRRYRGHDLEAAVLTGDLWDVPGAAEQVAETSGASAQVLRPESLCGSDGALPRGFGVAMAAAVLGAEVSP